MASIKKARKIKVKAEKALTESQQNIIATLDAEHEAMREGTTGGGVESHTDLDVDRSKPSRKVGWRWRHPKPNGYGILSIEGTLYFARPIPIQGRVGRTDPLRWILTKIARNEVTYYVTLWPSASYHESGGVFIGSPNYPSCTCDSREEGGCKHAKAILALRQKNSL